MDTNENANGLEQVKPENSTEQQEITAADTTAENENEATHDELQAVEDFSGLDKPALLDKMEEAAKNPDTDAVKATVQKLKETFRELVREETEAKRRAWEATRESEDDTFEPANDPLSDRFEDLVKRYNQKRSELRRQKDVEQRRNYQKKLELLDELKALAETSESMNKAFDKLQDLQARWREIGQVPAANVNELRQNWQHHLDRFFDVVKISRELRDLDFKKNQELKNELIAKAEALKDEPSVRRALSLLHEIHEQWREIGPAGKEINDQLWEKFKAASDLVHERKNALLEDQKGKQLENLVKKQALCEKMEAEAAKTYDSHKGWQDANTVSEAIFAEWRTIGHVPKEDENKTWSRFKEARQKFFRARENFYAKQREEFKKNLDAKIALCEKAEALKESTDWKNGANQFKRLQDEWKKIGPVPRKVSEKTWQRFKAAADAFFENRNKQFKAADEQFKENAAKREALIAEANAANLPEDLNEARNVLGDFQKRWSEMPPSPRNERERIDNAWKAALDKLFGQLKEKGGDENTLLRLKYDQLRQTEKGRDQLYRERMNLQDKIKRLQGEINTLETNLGFFGKSKGAQSLVADYQSKVDAAKAEVDKLKAQLKMIPRD
jgi:flagellin-specific chaperone FliS